MLASSRSGRSHCWHRLRWPRDGADPVPLVVGEPRVRDFARRFDLSLTAGSDAHFVREIGRGRTVVSAATLEEAREAILKGNTVLSGRRSSPFNLLASAALQSLRRLAHPEPD